MTVTFFGHHDTPLSVRPVLRQTIEHLIIESGADTFYVGNHGNYDHMVARILGELSHDYNYVNCAIVLAYLPPHNTEHLPLPTIYPEGMEETPHRFAICKRNEWMISRSDIVVVYVTQTFGGAARYKRIAEKKGKHVINIAEIK